MYCSKLTLLIFSFILLVPCLYALPLLNRQNSDVFINKRDVEQAQFIQPDAEFELLINLPRTDRKNYLMHEQLMELLRSLESQPTRR